MRAAAPGPDPERGERGTSGSRRTLQEVVIKDPSHAPESALERWIVPLLAVAPALAVVAYLGAFAGAVPERSSAAEPPANDERVASAEAPAPSVEPGSLMGTIADRRALPDTIGVLLERSLPGSSNVEEYLVWLPPGLEKGDRKWPVVVYLHGRSLRGDDTSLLLRYGLPRYLAEGRSIPFIVVAPQVQPPGGWTDADRVAELLDEIEARYPVDRDRVYLTGYSMGGGGVWRVALEHGDRFAAAVPLAAHTPAPTPERTRALSRLPFLVYHGSTDAVTPVAPAVAMVDALRGVGADVELRLIEGAGHGDLTTIFRDPALYAWMLKHARR